MVSMLIRFALDSRWTVHLPHLESDLCEKDSRPAIRKCQQNKFIRFRFDKINLFVSNALYDNFIFVRNELPLEYEPTKSLSLLIENQKYGAPEFQWNFSKERSSRFSCVLYIYIMTQCRCTYIGIEYTQSVGVGSATRNDLCYKRMNKSAKWIQFVLAYTHTLALRCAYIAHNVCSHSNANHELLLDNRHTEYTDDRTTLRRAPNLWISYVHNFVRD